LAEDAKFDSLFLADGPALTGSGEFRPPGQLGLRLYTTPRDCSQIAKFAKIAICEQFRAKSGHAARSSK
jgi:hypothetical protein